MGRWSRALPVMLALQQSSAFVPAGWNYERKTSSPTRLFLGMDNFRKSLNSLSGKREGTEGESSNFEAQPSDQDTTKNEFGSVDWNDNSGTSEMNQMEETIAPNMGMASENLVREISDPAMDASQPFAGGEQWENDLNSPFAAGDPLANDLNTPFAGGDQLENDLNTPFAGGDQLANDLNAPVTGDETPVVSNLMQQAQSKPVVEEDKESFFAGQPIPVDPVKKGTLRENRSPIGPPPSSGGGLPVDTYQKHKEKAAKKAQDEKVSFFGGRGLPVDTVKKDFRVIGPPIGLKKKQEETTNEATDNESQKLSDVMADPPPVEESDQDAEKDANPLFSGSSVNEESAAQETPDESSPPLSVEDNDKQEASFNSASFVEGQDIPVDTLPNSFSAVPPPVGLDVENTTESQKLSDFDKPQSVKPLFSASAVDKSDNSKQERKNESDGVENEILGTIGQTWPADEMDEFEDIALKPVGSPSATGDKGANVAELTIGDLTVGDMVSDDDVESEKPFGSPTATGDKGENAAELTIGDLTVDDMVSDDDVESEDVGGDISDVPYYRPPLDDELDEDTLRTVQEALSFYTTHVESDDFLEGDSDLDERISEAMGSAAATSVGSSRTYAAARDELKGAKARAQNRLSRTAYEKEKAAEKIAKIKAQTEKEQRKIEEELEQVLQENQAKIDEEVVRMRELLQAEINLEAEREATIVDLLISLQDSIAAKKGDVSYFENISNEMVELRDKLKPGPGRDQIEGMLNEKRKVAKIENELLIALEDCLEEMRDVLVDAQARADRTKGAQERFVPPNTDSDLTQYEWTDIEHMENILEMASKNVQKAEDRIMYLSTRINEALIERAVARGEEVPDRLKPKKFGLAVKNFAAGALAVRSHDVMDYSDLKDKNESELLGVLGSAIGKTAQGAAKAAFFSIKAIYDTVTDSAVSKATNEVIEKSSGMSQGFSQVSGEVKKLKKPQDIAESEVLKESAKSTGEVLGAVGKTGQTIVSAASTKESTEKATAALKETTQDFLSSINAVTALTTKYLQNRQKREKPKDEDKE